MELIGEKKEGRKEGKEGEESEKEKGEEDDHLFVWVDTD